MDEIWSIDLAAFSDLKISNNNGFRYIILINDKFLKNTWCVLLKVKKW